MARKIMKKAFWNFSLEPFGLLEESVKNQIGKISLLLVSLERI
jgi:hypothetical protein